MQGILNLIKLIPVFISLIFGTITQARYAKSLLSDLVNDYPTDSNGKPKDRVIGKMFTYGAVAYFSVKEYARLFDRPISQSERRLTTILNAMIVGYDELIDSYDTPNTDLISMIKSPETYTSNNYLEQIVLNLYKDVLSQIDPIRKEEVVKIFLDVNTIQVKSKLQRLSDTGIDAIKDITLSKGGSTVVLYLQILNWIKSEQLYNTFFVLGGWLQLNDDKADYNKDKKNGVITMYTYENNYEKADAFEQKLRQQVFNMMMNLDFPQNRKRHILYVFFVIVTLHNAYVVASSQKSKLYKILNQNGVMSSFITMLLSVKYCYKEIYRYNYKQI